MHTAGLPEGQHGQLRQAIGNWESGQRRRYELWEAATNGNTDENASLVLGLWETQGDMGSWSWSLDDDRMRWSAGFFRMLGLDPLAVEPSWDLLESLVHSDDAGPDGAYARPVPHRGPHDRRFRVVRPGGDIRWLRLISGVAGSSSRQPGRVIGVAIDVTAALRHSEISQRFEGLVDSLHELFELSVWRTEADGGMGDRTEWWQLTGQHPPGNGPWAHLVAVHPDDRQKVHASWAYAIRTGTHRCDVRVMVHGEYVQARSRGAPIRDISGAITGWIGVTAFGVAPQVAGKPSSEHGDSSLLSPAQVRAARGLLDWTARELAERSGVSFSTVRRIEMPGPRAVREENLRAVRTTFERHGIEFIVLADGRPGLVSRN